MNRETQIQMTKRMLAYRERPEESLREHISYLDVSTYTSETQLRQEKEILFRNHPIVVGFSCQLPEPGDFLTGCDTGVPILAVRGPDGRVNAFLNVCRHRGAAVAEEAAGKGRRNFACPYHGLVYDTEGRLISIPDGDYGFAGLDPDTMSLIPLPVEERYGFVWVVPNPKGSIDLDDYLGGLAEDLAAYGFDSYHHFETRTFKRRMNWKLVSDGFGEAYHIKVLHKKTIDSIFHSKGTAFDSFGRHHRLVAALRSLDELRGLPEAEWDLIPHSAIVYNLFPNTVFLMQGDHIEVARFFPGAHPGESTIHFSLFTPEPCTTESARGHWQRNMDLLVETVEQEDFRVEEQIQVGVESGALTHQVHSGYEQALAHFHGQVRQALGQPAAAALHAAAN